MTPPWKLTAALLCVVTFTAGSAAMPEPVEVVLHHSPPPSIEVKGKPGKIKRNKDSVTAMATLAPEDQYSIGAPSGEEQAFVELINRARANANAESLRLANSTDPEVLAAICSFGVDLPEMINQFATLDQILPPLSIHPELTEMTRLHSQDMLTNVFQGHVSSGSPPSPYSAGDTLADRAAEFSYPYSILGENVFAFGKSVYYSHAGFEIDWGSGTFGMQSPPDHRLTIHSSAYREIGVGVVLGSNSSEDETVGPLIVTQVLGSKLTTTPFITGVAYYDLNSNGIYDAGEGLGGLTVHTDEESAWALTANSGGYSIPVSSDGTYTVTFSGLGITPQVTSVNITGGNNTKHDLALSYPPPVIGGTATPITAVDNQYIITTIPGATAYWATVYTEDDSAWTEGAENGTADITLVNEPEYNVIQAERVKSGSFAFHLAHTLAANDQLITLNFSILPTASSELLFTSRLQFATISQVAHVDISTDEGSTWTSIYSQAGTGGAGEPSFIIRSISLSGYAGIPVRIRFRYSVEGCGQLIYNQTTTNVGWLLDDISVTNSGRVSIFSQTLLGSTAYLFNPPSDGIYHLEARPVNNSKIFPAAPLLKVTAGPATPFVLWRIANFSQDDLNDPAKEASVWGDLADPEKDGLGNLLEYALNGDPNLPDSAGLIPLFARSGNTLTLDYVMQKSDVTYRVLTNTILEESGWTDTGVTQTPNPDSSAEGTPIQATTTLNGERRFLKLEATLP
jgi:uncharacterized protein YkwD